MSLNAAIEAELPGLRTQAESRMTSRCTVKREATDAEPVTDADGYESQPWEVLETDLPIRLGGSQSGASGTRTVTVGGVQMVLAVRVAHVPATTTGIQDGDVIEVTSGECEGVFLRIVEAAFQDQATARRLPVVETQQPRGWTA